MMRLLNLVLARLGRGRTLVAAGVAVFLLGLVALIWTIASRPEVRHVRTTWERLDGWNSATAQAMAPAFRKSCDVWARRDPAQPLHANPLFGTVGDWRTVCDGMANREGGDLKSFFEDRLELYEVRADGSDGLFTGYYEPEITGSFEKGTSTAVPLHRRPSSLLVADLGDFKPELKGQRITARAEGGRLKPFYTRADITKGALGTDDILLWVDDPVDAFFLHIQGSGKVRLPGGRTVNVGYAAQNGHPYTAIGRYMADKGWLKLEDVTMPAIRAWLRDNPDKLAEVLVTNASYVFFALRDGGPYGTMGAELIPDISLAVDTAYMPLGIPLFVDTTISLENDAVFRRAMVAQDTGGAIKGAVRGDIFFGNGGTAENRAGHQKAPGRLFVMVPRHKG